MTFRVLFAALMMHCANCHALESIVGVWQGSERGGRHVKLVFSGSGRLFFTMTYPNTPAERGHTSNTGYRVNVDRMPWKIYITELNIPNSNWTQSPFAIFRFEGAKLRICWATYPPDELRTGPPDFPNTFSERCLLMSRDLI